MTNRDRDESLLNDLEVLYDVEVPDLKVPVVSSAPVASHSMRWRPVALAAAGLAGLALFLGAASPFGGSPTAVNAETILQRTAGVAASRALAAPETSYHMVSRHESFLEGTQRAAMDTVTEVWYRDPGHQRSESRDADGNVLFGTVQSGSDIWMYSANDGKARAVHGNVDTLGFRAGVPANFGGADSLSDLLTLYSGGGCSSAKLVDEERVAGRETYVIEVKPTWETCPFKVSEDANGRVTVKGDVKTEVGSPNSVTAPASAPQAQFVMIGGGKSDTTTKMWVDAETFINLKTETYDGDKLLFHYEVTEFATGIDIPDSVFTYTPPAGVEVVEATTPQQMKGVLSGEFGIVTFEGGHGVGAGGEPVKVEKFQAGPLAP